MPAKLALVRGGGVEVRASPSVRTRLPSGSGALAAAAALFMLLTFSLLYLIDPLLYLRIMRYWVPEAWPVPFVDLLYVQQHLECWRVSEAIQAAAPCRAAGRGFAYPPLWLRLWFLPAGEWATVPMGFSLALGFIASLTALPPIRQRGGVLLFLAGVLSPATAYAVERGNVDLLMFILAAFAAVAATRSLAARLTSYAGIVLATLLKLYPAVLLAMIARERPRTAIAAGLIAVSVIGIMGLAWQDEFARMMSNIPSPQYKDDGPGARKLPEGIFILINGAAENSWLWSGARLDEMIPRRVAVTGLSALALAGALSYAIRLGNNPALRVFLTGLTARERTFLTIGGLLFCGCFVTGTSIAYREIMLLFTIPALYRLSRAIGSPWPWRAAAWMIVGLMWFSYPALLLDIHAGPLGDHGGPLPTFVFWMGREFLWWWLFILLTGCLLCLARPVEDVDTNQHAA